MNLPDRVLITDRGRWWHALTAGSDPAYAGYRLYWTLCRQHLTGYTSYRDALTSARTLRPSREGCPECLGVLTNAPDSLRVKPCLECADRPHAHGLCLKHYNAWHWREKGKQARLARRLALRTARTPKADRP